MITKKTLTRQSIDELAKVCPGVTVPERAMSTIYGQGDGTEGNPFTWHEYMVFLESFDSRNFPADSGAIYYINQRGEVEGSIFIGTATVTETRPEVGPTGIVTEPEEDESGNKLNPPTPPTPPTGGGGGGGGTTSTPDPKDEEEEDDDYKDPNITGKLPDPKPKKTEYVEAKPCVFDSIAGIWNKIYGDTVASFMGHKNKSAFSSAIEAKYYKDYRDTKSTAKGVDYDDTDMLLRSYFAVVSRQANEPQEPCVPKTALDSMWNMVRHNNETQKLLIVFIQSETDTTRSLHMVEMNGYNEGRVLCLDHTVNKAYVGVEFDSILGCYKITALPK